MFITIVLIYIDTSSVVCNPRRNHIGQDGDVAVEWGKECMRMHDMSRDNGPDPPTTPLMT